MSDSDVTVPTPAKRKPRAAKLPADAPIAASVVAEAPAPAAPVAAPEEIEAPAAQAAEMIEAVSSPAVVRDVAETAVAMAPALIKETETMATTIETPTVEKAQAMFGDMSDRIKTAFEKSTKVGEELAEFTKGNVEAMVASAKVAAKGGETLGQEAAEYGKKSFENAVAVLKSFTQVRTPTEFFQVQSDYAKSSIESAVAEASKVSESLLRLAGDVVQPLSNRYAVAAEKFKATSL